MKKAWGWLMGKPLVALLIGAFVGMAIGGAGASTSSTATKQEPQPAVTVTATATVTAAPATPIATKTVTVRYTAPPDAKYRSIKKFSGRGSKNTEPFTIPASAARWRICYNFRGNDNAILKIIDPSTGETVELVLNEIGAYADCTVRYESVGTEYALEIDGSTWTVDVQITG